MKYLASFCAGFLYTLAVLALVGLFPVGMIFVVGALLEWAGPFPTVALVVLFIACGFGGFAYADSSK